MKDTVFATTVEWWHIFNCGRNTKLSEPISVVCHICVFIYVLVEFIIHGVFDVLSRFSKKTVALIYILLKPH